MAQRRYAQVKPELLRWARESAGLTPEEAARKLNVKAERVNGWESGAMAPTVPQLRNVAHVYKRPLAAFFLPAPPVEPPPLHDFRRLRDQEIAHAGSALLLEMRRARRRRAIALQLLDELGREAPSFALRARLDEDPDAVGRRGRAFLRVELAEQERWQRPYVALASWLSVLESHFVLVFQTSDVNLEEMRGFSLSESQLPVIALNGKDSPRGRIFTVMHEFAHLMLHQGGVCDPVRVHDRAQSPDERVEVFCNAVAGALLVPTDALLSDTRVAEVRQAREWSDSDLRSLADRFVVSREVILRRLLTAGRTTESFYRRKRTQFIAEYREQQAQRSQEGGFVPRSRLVVRNNGKRYTQLVLEAHERDRITAADVSDYLGVRLKHLDDIAHAVSPPGAGA